MNRPRFWLLGAFVLISALLTFALFQRRRQPLYQLAHYSQKPALKSYVAYVASELKPFTDGDSILGIHEPTNGTFQAVAAFEINSDGSVNTTSITPGNKGTGLFVQFNLSAVQLTEVKRLMAQLPPNAPPRKSEDVILVLTDRSTLQPVRLYDRHNLPPQIGEIFGLLSSASGDNPWVRNSQLHRSKFQNP